MPDGLSLQDLLGASSNPNEAIQQNLAQYLGNQQTQQQMSANQQSMQVQAFQLQQAQQAAQQQQNAQQAWQQDVGSFIQNPTAEGASNLQLRHPEQAKAIQQSWETRDAAVQAADKQNLATVYSYIQNGQPDAAKQSLQQRLDADKAAGKSEPMVQHLLDSFDQDPTGTHAKGMSAMLLALSPDGDRFAKTLSTLNGEGKDTTHVINEGGALVDNTGKVLYQAGKGDKFEKIKNADGTESIVAIPQGSSAPGAPLSGRTAGGWTPAVENGGDNPRPVVDAKIAGAAKYLGVDPTADISKMSPMQIAQAMTLSEGGQGSLADRNNNPANLRNADGSYKQFPTKQAGLNAAAALVAKKLKNGQTTVQSLVEGLPVGGTGNGAGGARVVATSKGGDPLSGEDAATVNFYAQKVAAGGDLPQLGMGKDAARLRQAILARSAQIQMGQGMSGADSNLLHMDVKTAGTALGQLEKNANGLDQALTQFDGNVRQVRQLAPKGVAGGVPLFNKWIQAGRTSLKGDPDVSKFNVAINAVANENAKIMSGASGGVISSDSARHEAMSLINNAQSMDQLMGVLDQMETDTKIRKQALDDRRAQLRAKVSGKPIPQAAPQAAQATQILPSKPNPLAGPPPGATRAARNPKTGQTLYLVNGKWVSG